MSALSCAYWCGTLARPGSLLDGWATALHTLCRHRDVSGHQFGSEQLSGSGHGVGSVRSSAGGSGSVDGMGRSVLGLLRVKRGYLNACTFTPVHLISPDGLCWQEGPAVLLQSPVLCPLHGRACPSVLPLYPPRSWPWRLTSRRISPRREPVRCSNTNPAATNILRCESFASCWTLRSANSHEKDLYR